MEFTTLLGLFAVFATVSSNNITAVNLRTAVNYVILAESGISTTGTTAVTGPIGLSPAAASFITGFSLILSSDGTYSTSTLVTGKVYAADYTSPTPSKLTTAVSDMVTAYNDAAGRLFPNHLNRGSGSLNAVTLHPGLYKWTTALTLGGTIKLNGNGNPNSVFIFQISGTTKFNSDCKIILKSGTLAQNVFWQSAGTVTLYASSAVKGIILAKTNIVFDSGATLTGKCLAQTAITMIANTVTNT